MLGSSGEELALAGGIMALFAGVAGSIGLGIAVEKLPGLLTGAGIDTGS